MTLLANTPADPPKPTPPKPGPTTPRPPVGPGRQSATGPITQPPGEPPTQPPRTGAALILRSAANGAQVAAHQRTPEPTGFGLGVSVPHAAVDSAHSRGAA
jgi:hypothetical protein